MRRLAPLVMAALAACSCSVHSSRTSWTTNDAIVQAGTGQPTLVAWYHDGQLLGADAVDRPDFPLRDFVRKQGAPVQDHPDLERWRGQLQALEQAADATPLDELLACAADLPFVGPIEAALEQRTADRPDAAAAVLDRVRGLRVRDPFAERLVATATGAGDLDDDRAVRWVRDLLAEDHEQAAGMVAAAPGAGSRTAHEALASIDEFRSADRLNVFHAAARRAGTDTGAAIRIVRAAADLRSDDAGACLLELLREAPAAALAREVLRNLDERRSAQRLDLFVAAAAVCAGDPAGRFALADALEPLRAADRLAAMRAALANDGADAELAVILVDRAELLPTSDRARWIDEVLAGRHAADPRVRDACRTAAPTLRRADRDRILQVLETW
ncbi:MAG: hypothetical protein AB7O97_18395 [Planctomycetota bacterium]